ncbi:MAG TPA: glutathione S-transferase family protein [Caulobacteraceae bacterium]|jgi:glutathione S-transferase|nr:glutathione S-transferase family protein [Caulobacteraceae bacterium]
MTANPGVTLFHSPQSRSSGALTLLEELGAPFELRLLNMKAGEQRQPGFLAINPMGKVPAILHGEALVTEQVAIFIYLADLFPKAGLAPAIGDPLRGPYLRWMAFYAACYEPALVDKAMKRDQAPLPMSTYGDWDTMLGAVIGQLAKGPYILGDRFSAADVLWGGGLGWGRMFGIVPNEEPTIAAYVERVTSRPAFVKVAAEDAERAAAHQKAVETA